MSIEGDNSKLKIVLKISEGLFEGGSVDVPIIEDEVEILKLIIVGEMEDKLCDIFVMEDFVQCFY